MWSPTPLWSLQQLRSLQQRMKLDLFSRLANSYGSNDTNFVLSVDKRSRPGYGMARSPQHPSHSGEFDMDRRSFNRRILMGGGVAAATGVTSLSLGAIEATSAENPPRTAPAGGVVRHLKLYAEKLADGSMGYGFEKGKASVPGPLIDINEGDTLHIEFENTMDVAASLHAHGVDYDIASDGTRMNRSIVEPGETRTYTWRTHAPSTAQGRHLAAGQRGLLALPRPRRRHGPRHGRHPQGAVRAGRRPAEGRHPARQDHHDRLQRHDDQQQARRQEPGLRGHGGGPARSRHDHARRVLPHVPHPRSPLGGQPHGPAHRARRSEPGHRHEDRRACGLLRLPGRRG